MQKARLLSGLFDPHQNPCCDINLAVEGIPNGSMPSGRDSHGELFLRSIVRYGGQFSLSATL